jgi:two-component system response regulator AtoC
VRDKAGLFEEASGGTLFLDEIGELPAALQVKLLRALQESEIRRLGDNRAVIVDVRVVAATVRNLQEDASHGRFREDLFYRLNVVHLPLPSLRERMEDIEALVELFLARFSRRYRQDTQVTRVSPEAMELLRAYTWPGNVRELENTIERAVVLCDGPVIEAAMLQDKVRKALPARAALAAPTAARGELSIKKTARAIESELIRRALETTGGNRTNAAKLLEISHRALLYKIKEYGL